MSFLAVYPSRIELKFNLRAFCCQLIRGDGFEDSVIVLIGELIKDFLFPLRFFGLGEKPDSIKARLSDEFSLHKLNASSVVGLFGSSSVIALPFRSI
jgi:hypothetical protein